MQISKWGNSLAVRLPVAVIEALRLKAGDDVEIRIADERAFEVSRKPGKSQFLERMRRFRGKLPPDFVFDREAANDR